jgi:uncharacterized membrane protein YadS
MDALTGPYAAAAALLVVGGAPKTWAPADTSRALRELRLPSARPLVRALGGLEVLTGVAALSWSTRPVALALAGWYAVFTVVVTVALRSDKPLASCGCFGRADTPPTRTHLVLVAAGTATAGAAALWPTAPLGPALGDDLAVAVPFVVLTSCVVWFGYLVMSRLAMLR